MVQEAAGASVSARTHRVLATVEWATNKAWPPTVSVKGKRLSGDAMWTVTATDSRNGASTLARGVDLTEAATQAVTALEDARTGRSAPSIDRLELALLLSFPNCADFCHEHKIDLREVLGGLETEVISRLYAQRDHVAPSVGLMLGAEYDRREGKIVDWSIDTQGTIHVTHDEPRTPEPMSATAFDQYVAQRVAECPEFRDALAAEINAERRAAFHRRSRS